MMMIIRLALCASILAASLVSEEPKSLPCGSNSSLTFVDLSGSKLPAEVEVIAWTQTSSTTAKAYTRADIAILVADLQAAGIVDAKLLNPAFWQSKACTKRNNSCNGDCKKGSCKEVTVKFTYCDCV